MTGYNKSDTIVIFKEDLKGSLRSHKTTFVSSPPPSSFPSIGSFSEEPRHIAELMQWPLLRRDANVACSQQQRGPRARFCRRRHHWRWWGPPWACEQRGWWTSGWSCSLETRSCPTSFLPCQVRTAPFSDMTARQQLTQFHPDKKMQKWFDLRFQ